MTVNPQKGIVFDIQPYSIHDGPGIRTTVFLKGCPLRCLWCQNPESNLIEPQLLYTPDRCALCGACISICGRGAIFMQDGKLHTDRGLCMGCGDCVSVCRQRARDIAGQVMDTEQVLNRVLQDKLFFDTSGGGMTLSGGEVLVQAGFARELLQKAKERGVHTAIETCGFGDWAAVQAVAEFADLVLYDVKCMDDERHKSYTGVSNRGILANLRGLSVELHKEIIVRTPVVPGCNDDDHNFVEMGAFLKENVETCKEIHLLPYHRMGISKAVQLEKTEVFESQAPDDALMEQKRAILRGYGFDVH